MYDPQTHIRVSTRGWEQDESNFYNIHIYKNI